MPAAQELAQDNAFNDTAYNDDRITKTISRDAHGVETVTFTDSDGKLLAAARSGNEENTSLPTYSMISYIKEQGFVDVHIPVGCSGITINNATTYNLKVYDLMTEDIITTNVASLPSGFYRVAIENVEGYTYDSNNEISINYEVNYYDYVLNTYDKAGRLLTTSQPKGADIQSTFVHNSFGQLIETISPDTGTARFKYRKDGLIRFSQNSEQAALGEVSFTDYDDFGRPVRSGVATADFDSLNADISTLNVNLKEENYTVYDEPDTNLSDILKKCGLSADAYKQTFLYGNVAKTYTKAPFTTTTWYSYDVYGRVKWMVQDVYGLDCLKTIDYTYDYLTGQITKVEYQRGSKTEYFAHKYVYNEAGQLIEVSTSRDDWNYTINARYFYTKTGVLKRTEIAENLQGIDYVYNLYGQLKAINSPHGAGFLDPGNDSPTTNGFLSDVFGMVIDYHSNDYQRSGNSLNYGLNNTSPYNQLNGNIGSIRWSNNSPVANPSDTYNYSYNKNNWLSKATFGHSTPQEIMITNQNTGQSVGTGNYEPVFNEDANKDYEVSNITYDENGNIQALKRNGYTDGNGTNAMDEFTYNYSNGTNQLTYIEDSNDNPDATRYDDLRDQTNPSGDANYIYNSMGQLETNLQEGVSYEYNASGLVTKINEFSQTNTGSWATTYFNDFSEATLADATSWSGLGVYPGINYNGEYKIGSDHCVFLEDTYDSSLRLIMGDNTVAARTFSVLPDVPHIIDLDVIVRQTSKLVPEFEPPTFWAIGYHVRVKDMSGVVLSSATVNDPPQVIYGDITGNTGGGLITTCDYFYDEHNTLTFTTNDQEVILEIELFSPDAGQAILHVDNIELKAATVPKMAFFYNDRGHRVRKESYIGSNGFRKTYYVRDDNGSPLAIYNEYQPEGRGLYEPPVVSEYPIYGAKREGMFYNDPKSKSGGEYVYQLTDHLGSVRVVIMKVGNNALSLTNKTDYYPFGMPMPNKNIEGGYRYGYQGEFAEKDPETNMEAFELRLWDSRIGRWLTPDPYSQYHSPYLGMGNNPVNGVDPDGGCFINDENGDMVPCPDMDVGSTMTGVAGYDWTMTDTGWARSDGYAVDLGTLFNVKVEGLYGQAQFWLPADATMGDYYDGMDDAVDRLFRGNKIFNFGVGVVLAMEGGVYAAANMRGAGGGAFGPRTFRVRSGNRYYTYAILKKDGVYSGVYNDKTGQTNLAPSWDGPRADMPDGYVPRTGGHHVLRRNAGWGDENQVYGFTVKIEGGRAQIISWNSRSVNYRVHNDAQAAKNVSSKILNSLKKKPDISSVSSTVPD